MFLKISIAFVTFLALDIPSFAKSNAEHDVELQKVTENVKDRGLVSQTVNYTSIIRNHGLYCKEKHKHFSGDTLAYITPWNTHGYEIAKEFRSKFDYVSPVWYEFQSTPSNEDADSPSIKLAGFQNVNKVWLGEMAVDPEGQENAGESENPNKSAERKGPLIVPRFNFMLNIKEYRDLLADSDLRERIFDIVITECMDRGYGGIVLEITRGWAVANHYDLQEELVQFITELAGRIHAKQLQIILVIPSAFTKNPIFTREHFDKLAPVIDRFSLMTYDYSTKDAGPQAPLSWVGFQVRRLTGRDENVSEFTSKILMGLNMYGRDFSEKGDVDDVVGHVYVELLNNARPRTFDWDSKVMEHSFRYNSPVDECVHTVYYPTLRSINDRLRLAKQLGVGISLWEIGQGLDYFYDLF
eukprot:797897_1